MKYSVISYPDLGISVEIAAIKPHAKVKELQVIFHVTHADTSFNRQLLSICESVKRLLAVELFNQAKTLFAQCFLSDPANQQEQVLNSFTGLFTGTFCCVKQPPLDGSKIALWIILQTDVTSGNDGMAYHEHNGYMHFYTSLNCGLTNKKFGNSYEQTLVLLEEYEDKLEVRGCTISRDCIRTWFFVRDVDLNYQGVVEARKENFIKKGMTDGTHYIASTGIEGNVSDPNVKVLMNAYAIKGLDKGQLNFLYAKEYMNSTNEYGVTFERGVKIDFGDRRKVYISGTASIDNKGEIMFPGEIAKQVVRTWENVDALLKEADCSMNDIIQIIVYLRDYADYPCVKKLYDQKFPEVPTIIVLASICRTGWLVEMECMATKVMKNKKFRDL